MPNTYNINERYWIKRYSQWIKAICSNLPIKYKEYTKKEITKIK